MSIRTIGCGAREIFGPNYADPEWCDGDPDYWDAIEARRAYNRKLCKRKAQRRARCGRRRK